jgi:phosphate transport system protein
MVMTGNEWHFLTDERSPIQLFCYNRPTQLLQIYYGGIATYSWANMKTDSFRNWFDMTQGEHTSKQFDAELNEVRERVLQMGRLVESQVSSAIDVLSGCDEKLIESVIATDHRVNAMEVEIGEECDLIVVRRQPAAGDLRTIMAIIKIVTDLERIGDEAKNIAYAARLLPAATRRNMPEHSSIRHEAENALFMLRQSVDNFARLDLEAAMRTIRQEGMSGDSFDHVMRLLVLDMMEKPGAVSVGLETAFISKAFERIFDHAQNISKHVVYMVRGKDVRHIPLQEIERKMMEP